ncbi:MAG: hypothetical protein RH862_05615 [Leptospiraceae bacterium]
MQNKGTLWKGLGIGFLALVLAFLGFYGYMGGFQEVTVSRTKFGPHTIIYATHRGPYEDLGASWEKFENRWKDAGLQTCESLAVYLDPPDTPPEELRSILGCRIDQLDAAQQETLSQKFSVFEFPAMESIYGEFPYRNMLSFMLGPIKVYPEFQKVMEEGNVQTSVAFEVYGDPDNMEKIQFIMPVEEPRSTFAPLEQAFEQSL